MLTMIPPITFASFEASSSDQQIIDLLTGRSVTNLFDEEKLAFAEQVAATSMRLTPPFTSELHGLDPDDQYPRTGVRSPGDLAVRTVTAKREVSVVDAPPAVREFLEQWLGLPRWQPLLSLEVRAQGDAIDNVGRREPAGRATRWSYFPADVPLVTGYRAGRVVDRVARRWQWPDGAAHTWTADQVARLVRDNLTAAHLTDLTPHEAARLIEPGIRVPDLVTKKHFACLMEALVQRVGGNPARLVTDNRSGLSGASIDALLNPIRRQGGATLSASVVETPGEVQEVLRPREVSTSLSLTVDVRFPTAPRDPVTCGWTIYRAQDHGASPGVYAYRWPRPKVAKSASTVRARSTPRRPGAADDAGPARSAAPRSRGRGLTTAGR